MLTKVETQNANLFKCRSGKKWLACTQAIKMEAIAYCNSIANGEYFTKFEYLTQGRFTNEDHLNSYCRLINYSD